MLKDQVDLLAAAHLPIQAAGPQQVAALLLGNVLRQHADVPFPAGMQPLGIDRHLHAPLRALEEPLFVFQLLPAADQLFEHRFDPLEDPRQIVVIVQRDLGRTAPLAENRQLTHQTAQLRVRDQRMYPGRKGQAAEGTGRAVQRVQHEQVVQIARLLARQRDASFHDPLAEHLDLFADHVVDGPHDVQTQSRPRIDGQQRRDVVVVQLRHRFALAGALDPADRQQLVSGQLVGRQSQAEIEVSQCHRLVVAARTLVRQRQFRADIALLVRMLAAGDVRPAQRQIGNRQVHGHFAGLLERRL